MFIFFFFPSQCLCCHKPKFLDSTLDLLRESKLKANFTNIFSISYLLIDVCIEGEKESFIVYELRFVYSLRMIVHLLRRGVDIICAAGEI